MLDSKQPLYRRIDAAEVLISFEIAPGAANNIDPDQVAATSFQFLRAVVDAAETPEGLRFRALKCVASIENARAKIKSNNVTHAQKYELLIRLINGERSRALRAAGVWPLVIARGDPWSIETTDEFDWPNTQWPGSWAWPVIDLAAILERASRDPTGNEAFRAQLLAVRAKNRVDDWERLLGGQAA